MPTINDNTPASSAAKNIADVISAMTDAQKSQLDLKKAIAMKQIGDKMDLQQKQAEQNIDVQKPIQQTQAWTDFGNQSGGASTPTGATANGVGGNGVADSATAARIGGGGPMASPVPQTPPMSMANPSQQPANTAASQLTMPKVSQPVGQPQPLSSQYQNLGYNPVDVQGLVQTRNQAGQRPNVADMHYIQALQKLKAGTATDGEISMVNKMNNRDENGQAIGGMDASKNNNANGNGMQNALRQLEKMRNLPEGSLTFGADGNPEINPFVKSKIEAQQRAEEIRQVGLGDKYGKQVDDMFMKALSNRSGGLGLEDTKVNNAIHARVALDSYYDDKTGKYNIPPTMHAELALSLARQLSPNGVVGVDLMKELRQGSFEENAKRLMIMMGANPQTIGGTTQGIAKTLADALDRQGLVSQSNRDKNYFEPMTHTYAFRQLKQIDPDAAKDLWENHFGGDYKKFMNMSVKERTDYVKGLDFNTDQGGQNSASGQGSAPTYNVGDTRQTPTGTVTRQADGTWR